MAEEAVISPDSELKFFGGRMAREAYWPDGTVVLAACLLVLARAGLRGKSGILDALQVSAFIPFLVPLPLHVLTWHVKRLHDLGKSGWYVLLLLVPLVNTVVLLWMLVARGVPGPNRYGPGPTGGNRVSRLLYLVSVLCYVPLLLPRVSHVDTFLCAVLVLGADAITGSSSVASIEELGALVAVISLFPGILTLPILGYSIKRWHDIGKSGWAAVLLLIPGVNFLVLMYMLLAPGTQGPNPYGADPVKQRITQWMYLECVVVLAVANLGLFFFAWSFASYLEEMEGDPLPALVVVAWLAVPLCSLALRCHIQRYHDLGRSGWNVLLLLIPVANLGFFLELLLRPGTDGPNQYGPHPRTRGLSVSPNESRRTREPPAGADDGADQDIAPRDDQKYAPPGYFDNAPQP